MMSLPSDLKASLRPGIFEDTPDTPDGFEFFFSWMAQNEKTGEPLYLTPHAKRWIEAIYDSVEEDSGIIIKAFRGAAKSVVMSVFMAWRIGKNPALSNMIIRSSYVSAQDTGAQVAKIIAHHKNWKLFFPNIEPDNVLGGGGWSAVNGYQVIDVSMSRGEWTRLTVGRASPTLAAFPYSSKSIIGNRVTGLLLVDDIHDEDNTTSELELRRTKTIWNDTINRTKLPGSWTVFIGTPWLTNDLLADLEATGLYKVIETPIYTPEGLPTWPEMFDAEAIERLKKDDLTGGPGFARMFLLDPSRMEKRVFVYMDFEQDAVKSTWRYRGGVDYASIEGGGNLAYRSYFALSYVAQNPDTGDWVVTGGVLDQISQGEAEERVLGAQNMFLNWQYSVVEADGKGAEFIAVLARKPEIRFVPEKTGGINKSRRLLNGLEPLLRSGRVKISNGRTKFLDATRHFLNHYPNVSRNDPGWDALDSIYWAMFHEMLRPTGTTPKKGIEPTKNPFYLLAEMK